MSSAGPRKTLSALGELIYILKSQKLSLIVVLGATIILSCLNMSVPYALKKAVDYIGERKFYYLYYISGIVFLIYLARNAVYYFSKSRIVLLAERVAFDLRNAIVRIDLTQVQGYVFVQGGFGAVSLGRNDTYDPLRFALAVAQAAVSEADAPTIPMDRLLG